ncbi:hypothetical protein QYF36_001667 [Acer negundo]|nr:hypothetical protein QYF36_001667 [Acer negundo]
MAPNNISLLINVVTENYGWLPSDLLVEAQDNEKEATICCCNNHCNIAGQFLHQRTRGCTSAIKWSEGALREVVETVKIEVVDGELLRDFLELGSNDMKGLIQVFKDLVLQYSPSPSDYGRDL